MQCTREGFKRENENKLQKCRLLAERNLGKGGDVFNISLNRKQ